MTVALLFQISLVVSQLALAGALSVLIVKFVVVAISNGFDSPFLATPAAYLPLIADTLEILPGDIVYDVGCGDGRLVFFCAARYPHATFVGVERNPLLVAHARMQKKIRGNLHNVSFRCEDFFKTDLTDATRVYAYLLPKTLNTLFPDTHVSGKKLLVSRAYQLSSRRPMTKVELSKTPGSHGEHLLYVYEI